MHMKMVENGNQQEYKSPHNFATTVLKTLLPSTHNFSLPVLCCALGITVCVLGRYELI